MFRPERGTTVVKHANGQWYELWWSCVNYEHRTPVESLTQLPPRCKTCKGKTAMLPVPFKPKWDEPQ